MHTTHAALTSKPPVAGRRTKPRRTNRPAASRPAPRRPVWDKELRELRLGETVVISFRRPAPVLERILVAFQEENWPVRIDDPLLFNPDQEAKRRLHDAIKRLNDCQKRHLIQFRGDGTGTGVRWEFVT